MQMREGVSREKENPCRDKGAVRGEGENGLRAKGSGFCRRNGGLPECREELVC